MILRVARAVATSRVRFLGGTPLARKELFSLDLDVASHVAKDTHRETETGHRMQQNVLQPKLTGSESKSAEPEPSGLAKDASWPEWSRATPESPSESTAELLSEPASAPPQPELDLLDDIFADLVFDNQSGSNELDQLFQNVTSAKTVDLDKTTEDFVRDDSGRRRSAVLEEQNLFQEIFETYAQSQSSVKRSDKLEEQVLYNLQQSFNTASASLQPAKHGKLSHSATKEIHANVHASLAPTLDLLSSILSKRELLAFLNHTFSRYHAMDRSTGNFYVYKAKSERMASYQARCDLMCNDIKSHSNENAREPVLNVFTMPILFNHVLRVLGTKHYDGQLALSLFHALKQNIDLYTVVCNQQTYNEIMKLYWVYMGKASLCEVELVFLEMQNNGFSGDLATFSVLKEILTTYHSMRMGKTLYNPGGVPIWCQEDERRAKNLGHKLRALGHTLRKQRYA